MAMGRKLNNSAKKNDKNQISSYVISRHKWLPSTEIWGPLDEYSGRRSCARNQVTWYNLEQSDWFGINYHIVILVYRDNSPFNKLKRATAYFHYNTLACLNLTELPEWKCPFYNKTAYKLSPITSLLKISNKRTCLPPT